MELNAEERSMLAGEQGRGTQKAMEILLTLGKIYDAKKMIPVSSVQIAGVSYDNLGDAGLFLLNEFAEGGAKARVLATLNPAGMDVENWETLGIDADFAKKQQEVLIAFARMGVVTTCTCTPYLSGNVPHFGEDIAWAESSAVCYANSVLGARTNREGGPSALAAALTGRTPAYGFHLMENRRPDLLVDVKGFSIEVDSLNASYWFGVLGKVIGQKIQTLGKRSVPYIRGIASASVESLKAFSASIATYGGVTLFHMEGITPEAALFSIPEASIQITGEDVEAEIASLDLAPVEDVDFVSLGCPHLSIREIARIAQLLEGKKVTKEFWLTTSRPNKQIADMMGYSAIIEASGAKIAADTCCVVAPIRGRFHVMATDSAKACYYAFAKNKFNTVFKPFDEIVRLAVGEE